MSYIRLLLIALMLGLSSTAFSEPIEPLKKAALAELSEEELESRLVLLETRVQEIQSMDINSLDRKDKRVLKKELRQIDREMKEISGGGIYISTGAIIIILLLIILI